MSLTSNPQTALAFFKKHPLGTLATINQDKKPECAAVYAKFQDDFSAHFTTKTLTRKFENISHKPHVTFFCVDEAAMFCGEVSGTVEVIEGAEEAMSALSGIHEILTELRQEYWLPPISQLEAGSYTLLKLTPTYARVIDYSRFKVHHEQDPLINEIHFS